MHVVSQLKTKTAVDQEKNLKFVHKDSKITVDFNAFLEQEIEKFASINFNNIQVYGATQRMGIFRDFNNFSKLAKSSTRHQNSDTVKTYGWGLSKSLESSHYSICNV